LSHFTPPENIDYYIPNRYREGYGLSKAGVEYASSQGYKLLVTLDCGIKSVELIAEAHSMGIETIVCDHHYPGDQLPEAIAILNPKQPGCAYPYKDLCACGVVYKLVQALHSRLEPQKDITAYLSLVATATAADIVPMTGENRILSFHGLKQANSNPPVGFRALMDLGGIQQELSVNDLSFLIGPRINAAGRMDDAKKAVALFIEKDYAKAKELALLLQTDNASRKEADSQITAEALQKITEDQAFHQKKSTLVFEKTWHKGVVGIVASRLLERYFKPTIVLTQSGEFLSGSARSIPGFNIHDALERCQDLLIAFGGHYFAAGMTLHPDNLQAFEARMESIAQELLTEDMLIPEIQIDAVVTIKDLSMGFFNVLKQMEPFGPDCSKPIFCLKSVTNAGCRIVKGGHLRLEVVQDGRKITGIGFNMGERYLEMGEPLSMDILFHLEENHFNGNTTLQLRAVDILPA
jgi:single-stranded-DNA-specific exonuclease